MKNISSANATAISGARRYIDHSIRSFASAPYPAIAFIWSLILPNSMSLDIAGLHLPPYRICLLVLLPVALHAMASKRIKLSAPDFCVLAFALLQTVVLVFHHGLIAPFYAEQVSGLAIRTNAFVNSGTTIVESIAPYLIARAYLRTPRDVAVTMKHLIFIVLILLLPAIVESVTAVSIFPHDTFTFTSMQKYTRLGMHRAFGPFPHPILWGLFASSAFAFALAKGVVAENTFSRVAYGLFVLVAAITSVSSAAYAAIMFQCVLILWFRVSWRVPRRGLYFTAGCIFVYLFIELFSNRSPLTIFFVYAALAPESAYYRLAVWQIGWEDFFRTPLMGIGYAPWSRPAWMGVSLDNFWLLMFLRYGLLAMGPLVVGIYLALRHAVCDLPVRNSGSDMQLAYYWVASLISLLLAGITVHFWLQSFVELFFLLGAWGAFANSAHVRQNLVARARLRNPD